ncbi:MAG TPA: MBL fold metallo-hydrolase [Planctomycetota bacterium]|jgi:glyoxylase-like metal-dependent hydrolase (beta-lactamase superfamily II)
MDLIFEQIRVGGDRNFGYLLADRPSKTGVFIDPSYAPEMLVQRAREQELKITHVINTHGHADHTNGNETAVQLTGALVAAHPDCSCAPALKLRDEAELPIGSLRLKFYHVPGHCDDHIVIHEQTYDLLITGDLLFVGKIGGTRNDHDARIEFNSLRRLLSLVPGQATVWPGHDYGSRPSSTIFLEQHSNPFLQCADLPAFLRLKDDWPIFKKMHGLR